ncbi:MAG: (Fe-S)-binding protein [Planctomycetia bacterium]|nr:(Fe-S)-binding protein [Planctomycetia bacterium]
MQISQTSKKTIDACRFCWMCRHICPIGNATGQERNTSRARALGLSMVEREMEALGKIIDNMYECSLCGACTKECMTGWDPTQFTTEVKLEAALEGCLPEYVLRMVENVEKTGNAYGKTALDEGLKQEIASLPENASTLLYLGTDARYQAPEQARRAIQLLKKAGVEFTVLADEPGSGYDLYFLVGGAEETRQRMKQTAEILNRFETVVVYDPNDAKMFLRPYKEWEIGLTATIQTFTSYVAGLLETGKLTVSKSEKTYTFQDPAALARDLEETQSARKILAACGNLKEMLLHGKHTNLAGNLLMREYLSQVMDLVAKNRWRDAEGVGATCVVTASPSEYVCLKETQPEGMELCSLEEILL